MSLLPPSAVLMSKMYFFIKERYKGSTLGKLSSVLKKLGPFPIFRLHCTFNSNESTEEIIFTDDDIIKFISGNEDFSKVNRWDCVDTASNMFVRMVAKVKDVLHGKKGLVIFYLQYQYPTQKSEDWTDTFCDRLLLYDDSVDKQIVM